MKMQLSSVFLLVFITITALTCIVVLLANVNFFGSDVMHSDFAEWGVWIVLGEIISATILAFKWLVVRSPLILVVFYRKRNPNPKISIHECEYETADDQGKSIAKGRVSVVRDKTSDSWSCFIPVLPEMQYAHVTTFRLKDDKGKEVRMIRDFVLQHSMEV